MANKGAQRRATQRRARRKFEEADKRDIVRRFVEARNRSGTTLRDFAHEADIYPTVLRNWVAAHGKEFGLDLSKTRLSVKPQGVPIAPATSPSSTVGDMAPADDWAAEEGKQLKLVMGVPDEPPQNEDPDPDWTAENSDSKTLLSRPEPPSQREPRRKRGPGIVRVMPQEVYAHHASNDSAQESEGGGASPDFLSKVTTEVMADNAAMLRVMKIMLRESERRG